MYIYIYIYLLEQILKQNYIYKFSHVLPLYTKFSICIHKIIIIIIFLPIYLETKIMIHSYYLYYFIFFPRFQVLPNNYTRKYNSFHRLQAFFQATLSVHIHIQARRDEGTLQIERCLGCRWFCHFDDDNYVNVPRLLKLLDNYNPREDWYLGRPSIPAPLEIIRQGPEPSKRPVSFSLELRTSS